MLFRILFSIW